MTQRRPSGRFNTKWRAAEVGVALVLSLGCPQVASSQGWQPTPCSDAPFRLDGATCRKNEGLAGTAATGRVVFTGSNIYGRAGDYTYWADYHPPPPRTSGQMLPTWGTYGPREGERLLRNYAATRASDPATDFGTYKGHGDTSYLDYRRRSGASCVAFDHGGGAQGGAYLFYVRGEICSSKPIPAPETTVREFLSAVKINFADGQTRNALGAAPELLAWGPASVQPAATPPSQPRP